MLQLCGMIIICALIAALICLAKKNGKQAARLKDLKRELESISRAQELAANVAYLTPDDASRRLHEVSVQSQRSVSDSKF